MNKTAMIGSLCLTSVLTLVAAQGMANDYSYDDGGNNVTLGPPRSFAQYGDIDMLWGNYYETQDATEYVTNIEFELGRISANDQVTLWIFDDADNDYDPTNANLLFSMTVDSPMTGFDGINSIDIASTAVSGGFFVAVSHLCELEYDEMNEPDGYSSPARYDTDARADRSWFYYGSYGDLPEAGYSTRMDGPDVPFGGAFAIRATTTVPVPGTVLISSAGLLMATRRRR